MPVITKNDLKDPAIKKRILEDAEVWLEKKQKLLQLSEISLTLDTYDDIFSDFDPRPYSDRAISDDFLVEIKRATKENTVGVIELKFLIPKMFQNSKDEELIRKRLKRHFRRHFDLMSKEVSSVKKMGFIMVIAGFTLGILSAIIFTEILKEIDNMLFFTNIIAWALQIVPTALLILLEPASWFLIWEGLNKVIFDWKELKPDFDFYEKMTRCEIVFDDY